MNEIYNYCIVRRFPNGNIGLRNYGSHKFNIINNKDVDVNENANEIVSTFLFGATRMIKLSSISNLETGDIKLRISSGSLYVTRSPTDKHWSQELVKSQTNQPTITLTFYESITN